MNIPNRITIKVKANLIEIEGPRGKLKHLFLIFSSLMMKKLEEKTEN